MLQDPEELERSTPARSATVDAEHARCGCVRLDADAEIDAIAAPETTIAVEEPGVGGIKTSKCSDAGLADPVPAWEAVLWCAPYTHGTCPLGGRRRPVSACETQSVPMQRDSASELLQRAEMVHHGRPHQPGQGKRGITFTHAEGVQILGGLDASVMVQRAEHIVGMEIYACLSFC